MTEYKQMTTDELLALADDTGDTHELIHALAKRVRALTEAASGAYDWLENAPIDYRNGITCNGIDEGNVNGWRGHSVVVYQLADALGIDLTPQKEYTPPQSKRDDDYIEIPF